MTQRDPFDEYKRRREIEIMESGFREKAAEQRKRIEEIFASEDVAPGELEERVTKEMEDFLSESTRTAERLFGGIDDDEPAPPVRPEPRSAPRPAAPPPETPKPSVVDRRPLGLKQEGPRAAPDLKAALDRIRKHSRPAAPPAGDAAPPPRGATDSADARELSRREILDSFDDTCRQVSEMFQDQEPEDDAPPARGLVRAGEEDEADDRETFAGDVSPADAAALYRERVRKAAGDLGAPARAPAERPVAPSGAAGPAGSTNVFESEPGEDRDLDDAASDDPPGWNIPVKPPPPGVWIVQKQKSEGDAGLSGAAGDTYLLKKLSEEVRRLNRVYLVLLEKKVVTREEVEGPGSGGAPAPSGAAPAAPKKAPPPAAAKPAAPKAASADDDDDAVGVEDYDEGRYRPILTTDKDFSLTTLVKDVHRLKCLRDVLVKKGVVTEKELAKAAK